MVGPGTTEVVVVDVVVVVVVVVRMELTIVVVAVWVEVTVGCRKVEQKALAPTERVLTGLLGLLPVLHRGDVSERRTGS